MRSPCAQPYTHIWPSRFLGICWSFSKPPLDIILWFFFLNCWVTLLLATSSGSCDVRRLPQIVLKNDPQDKAVSTGQWVKSNNDSLGSGVFQRTSRWKKPDNSLKMGPWMTPVLFLPCTVVARLLVFTMTVAVGFLGYWGEEDGKTV